MSTDAINEALQVVLKKYDEVIELNKKSANTIECQQKTIQELIESANISSKYTMRLRVAFGDYTTVDKQDWEEFLNGRVSTEALRNEFLAIVKNATSEPVKVVYTAEPDEGPSNQLNAKLLKELTGAESMNCRELDAFLNGRYCTIELVEEFMNKQKEAKAIEEENKQFMENIQFVILYGLDANNVPLYYIKWIPETPEFNNRIIKLLKLTETTSMERWDASLYNKVYHSCCYNQYTTVVNKQTFYRTFLPFFTYPKQDIYIAKINDSVMYKNQALVKLLRSTPRMAAQLYGTVVIVYNNACKLLDVEKLQFLNNLYTDQPVTIKQHGDIIHVTFETVTSFRDMRNVLNTPSCYTMEPEQFAYTC